MLAPLAWVMLALLMALLQQEQEGEPGFSWSALANGIRDPAFQAPMRLLAWNTAETLFWPVIAVAVFVLLRGTWRRRPPLRPCGREPCPFTLGAEQLGGIPPYPGMPCAALVHLHNAYGEQMLYVFNAQGSDSQAIHAHFARWADAHAGSSASSTGGSQLFLSAGSRDGAWRLEVESRQGGATSVVIRHRTEPTR